MAKKKTAHRRRGFTLPPIAIIVGLMPGLQRTFYGFQADGLRGAVNEASKVYLGYVAETGKWYGSLMWYGFAPLVLGMLVHRGATAFGINRMLARARIPIRI